MYDNISSPKYRMSVNDSTFLKSFGRQQTCQNIKLFLCDILTPLFIWSGLFDHLPVKVNKAHQSLMNLIVLEFYDGN